MPQGHFTSRNQKYWVRMEKSSQGNRDNLRPNRTCGILKIMAMLFISNAWSLFTWKLRV
jgi:hypothetical protein